MTEEKFFSSDSIYVDPAVLGKNEIQNCIQRYGGNVISTYEGATHIITSQNLYSKLIKLLPPSVSVRIVTPEWVKECNRNRMLMPERYFSAAPRYFLSGCIVCTTQIKTPDRQNLINVIETYGGMYTDTLSQKCTHLLALREEGDKFNFAVKFNENRGNARAIHVVAPDWLLDSFRDRCRQYEAMYPVDPATANLRSTSSTDYFKGFVFYVLPMTTWEHRDAVCRELLRHGAQVRAIFSDLVTHAVVQFREGSAYAQVAVRDHIKMITAHWIHDSVVEGKPVGYRDKVLYAPMISSTGIPGMADLVISVTGFTDNERADQKDMISLAGATYTGTLSLANTHLVALDDTSFKYQKAKEWGIKVVNKYWLADCLKFWVHRDETLYENLSNSDVFEEEAPMLPISGDPYVIENRELFLPPTPHSNSQSSSISSSLRPVDTVATEVAKHSFIFSEPPTLTLSSAAPEKKVVPEPSTTATRGEKEKEGEGEGGNDGLSLAAGKKKRGRPAGKPNKPKDPTLVKQTKSKAKQPKGEGKVGKEEQEKKKESGKEDTKEDEAIEPQESEEKRLKEGIKAEPENPLGVLAQAGAGDSNGEAHASSPKSGDGNDHATEVEKMGNVEDTLPTCGKESETGDLENRKEEEKEDSQKNETKTEGDKEKKESKSGGKKDNVQMKKEESKPGPGKGKKRKVEKEAREGSDSISVSKKARTDLSANKRSYSKSTTPEHPLPLSSDVAAADPSTANPAPVGRNTVNASSSVSAPTTTTTSSSSSSSRGKKPKPLPTRPNLKVTIDDSRPASWVFCVLGNSQEKAALAQDLVGVGATLVKKDGLDLTATHYVVAALKRTEKFMCALALGCPVLTQEYVAACKSAGSLVPYRDYMWRGDDLTPDGKVWVGCVERFWQQHGLDLSTWGCAIVGDTVPPKGTLTNILMCASALLVKVAASGEHAVKTEADARTKGLTHVISPGKGLTASQKKILSNIRAIPGVKIISPSFVLNLLTQKTFDEQAHLA